MKPPQHPSRSAIHLIALLVLVAFPLLFWSITGQVWEDFLITFRQAANALEGHGLTYNPGTLLHSFTSPLNVLVPLFFGWLLGTTEFPLPLILYNFVSVACLAGGGLLGMRVLEQQLPENHLPRWTLVVFPLLLVLSVRVTAFTVNGQEAGFWVLFLGVSLLALSRGFGNAWLLAGISWGGLMWTRPDSPIHITLLAIAALAFPLGKRRAEFIGILKAAGVCTAVYLPWFCWAWWYYGTPVPHTVMAKSGAYTGILLQSLDAYHTAFRWIDAFGAPFMPIYSYTAGWPIALPIIMALATLSIWVGAFLLRDRLLRLVALLHAGSFAYLFWMALTAIPFPWYFPPAAFFGALALARLLQLLWPLARTTARRWLLRASLAVLSAAFVFSFAASLRQIALHQSLVENDVRRVVGLYLQVNKAPGDRIFLEPIGYIGYFSKAHVIDYPGLVAPETLEARLPEPSPTLHGYLAPILKTEWVVFRPNTYMATRAYYPEFDELYRFVVAVSSYEEIIQVPHLFGRNYLLTDSQFLIFKRADSVPPPTE